MCRALWIAVLTLGMAACSSSGGDPLGQDGGLPDAGAVTDAGSPGDGGQDAGTAPVDGGSHLGAALFEAAEPWTKDVSQLPVSSRSQDILDTLEGLGGWGNGNVFQIDFTIPLFFANASTPRMTVTGVDGYCYGGGPDCEAVPLQVPVPDGSNFEGSDDLTCDTEESDCHLLVAEPDAHKLYELYNGSQNGSDLEVLGAFVWDLTRAYPDSERGDQCTSADAAGLPIAGLLPTADEVASGEIHHALRFTLPNDRMKAGVYVHPASHAGSPTSDEADAPPYGVRFRLKASFDETPYNASEKVILHALKTYGMILSDGGYIALTFADDRTSTAKWSELGIDSHSFNTISVDQFEVVDLGDEIPLTFNCVRNP